MSDALELEHVFGYSSEAVNGLNCHPIDKSKIIFPCGGVLVLSNLEDMHDQTFLRGHVNPISSVAVSPDGVLIATGEESTLNGEALIQIWDWEGRNAVFRLHGHKSKITCLAFSSNSHFLASTDDTGRLMIWDMEGGQLITSTRPSNGAGIITWANSDQTTDPRGRHARYTLVSSFDSHLRIHELTYDVRTLQFNLSTDTFQVQRTSLAREFTSLIIDPSDMYLLAGTSSGDFALFGLQNTTFKELVLGCPEGITCMKMMGDILFLGSKNGHIKQICRDSNHNWIVENETQLSAAVTSMSLTSDYAELIVATADGVINRVLSDTLDNTEFSRAPAGPVTSVCYTTNNDNVITMTDGGVISRWNLNSYSEEWRQRVKATPQSMAVSSTGEILTGWTDGFIRCHDDRNGAKMWEINGAHRDGVSALNVAQGKILSGGMDGTIRVWSLKDRRMTAQSFVHRRAVFQVILDHNDSKLIHSCGGDRTVATTNIETERRIAYHDTPNSSAYCISQRQDSELEVIAGTGDASLLFYDIDESDAVDGWKVGPEEDAPFRVTSCVVSPKGRYLAACGGDRLVRVWDIKDAALIGTGLAHSKVAWSPDERQLVSVGEDGCLVLWNFFDE